MKKDLNSTCEAFVGIVLLNNNQIYLVKEDDKNMIGKNRWNLPGGSIDGDESLTEAAKRETKEETGYEVKITSLLGCYKCKKSNSSWVYVVFEGKIMGKTNKKTDKGIKRGRWFEKNKFLHLDASAIVHPDMQLVYKIAIEGKGLSVDTVKFIDYDIQ